MEQLRRILFVLIIFLVPEPVCLSAQTVVHHNLDTVIFPDQHKIQVTDNLTIQPDRLNYLLFHVAENARIHELDLDGRRVPYTFGAGDLRVGIPKASRNKRLALKIVYEAVFDDPVPILPANTDNPGYGVTGSISNQGVFILSGACWYPEVPGSRQTFRLSVRVPEGILAMTAGRLLGHVTKNGTTVSSWEIEQPLEGLSLSAARYEFTEQDAGNVKVYGYFLPESRSPAKQYLGATVRYIGLYEDLFGPYPFEKFAIVENFFPTGYGFPSYTLLGSSIIRLPFIIETSLGHEVAHSWWGNGVFVNYEEGNWSEGLTTYVADYLYKERSSPEEAAQYRAEILRDYATLVSPDKDFPLKEFTSRTDPVNRVIGYGKSAMVFHMARRTIGDDAFWAALKDVYREKKFKTASWGDFRRAFEKRGNRDLKPFFGQWIYRKGAPVLSLGGAKSSKANDGWRIEERIIQKQPYYRLSLPVIVETEGSTISKNIEIWDGVAPFDILTTNRPRRVSVDPKSDVFRRLSPEEIPATVNSLKASDSLTIIVSEGLGQEFVDTAGLLSIGLGHEPPRVVREEEITPEIVNGDILFIGLPRDKRIGGAFPKGFVFEKDRFRIADKAFDSRSYSFFGVFKDPNKVDRTIGVFLSRGENAGTLARKIPHYGKYSYLVFQGDQIFEKNSLKPEKTPLEEALE